MLPLTFYVCRYPIFENPYPLTIHESPVTCCEYFADCPDELIPALYSVGSRQKRQGYSKKVTVHACAPPVICTENIWSIQCWNLRSSFQEWPISGGNWGQGTQSYPEIIITGWVYILCLCVFVLGMVHIFWGSERYEYWIIHMCNICSFPNAKIYLNWIQKGIGSPTSAYQVLLRCCRAVFQPCHGKRFSDFRISFHASCPISYSGLSQHLNFEK